MEEGPRREQSAEEANEAGTSAMREDPSATGLGPNTELRGLTRGYRVPNPRG